MKWPQKQKTESSGALPGFDHEPDGHLALEDFQRVLTKRAPESQTKRQSSFVRYLVAICIGVVGTLAWQSYGEATKQTPATTASELGCLPESNLARWVQQLGWTKQPADLENAALWLAAPETSQPTPVAQVVTESLDDAAQRQEVALGLATLRQTVEQIAAAQDKTASEINRLSADVEMLSKIPAHAPEPRVASARKPMPTPLPPLPRSPPPLTPHL
jgi:hypothetical protein